MKRIAKLAEGGMIHRPRSEDLVGVDVVRFDGEMDGSLELWLGDAFNSWLPSKHAVEFRTREGLVVAHAGDQIVRSAPGEFSLRELDRRAPTSTTRSTEENAMATQAPTIGRIVHYTLTEADVARIVAARMSGEGRGNAAHEGDVLPALVVRVWADGLANLQVFLDGDHTLWATSRHEGEGAGTWAWPARS